MAFKRYTITELKSAFEAGREKIKHPDYDYVFSDFDQYIATARDVKISDKCIEDLTPIVLQYVGEPIRIGLFERNRRKEIVFIKALIATYLRWSTDYTREETGFLIGCNHSGAIYLMNKYIATQIMSKEEFKIIKEKVIKLAKNENKTIQIKS